MKSTMMAAAVSTMFVAPLAYLELMRGAHNYSSFPYALFVTLWAVPTAFLLAALPLMRALKAGENVLNRPLGLTARAIFLLLAAAFWAVLVADQMPCFLGVPNCD